MQQPAVVREWGSTVAERASAFDCDALMPRPDAALFRGVDVAAPASVTFRWLCQLRAAPYSYDLIDNLGRRSPRELTPGLQELAVGQRINTIFRITAFTPGRCITMQTGGGRLGGVACTYRADPVDDDRSRIVVKFLVQHPRVPVVRQAMAWLLPPGDLVMMRRQLLNLSALAAR